MNIGTLRALQCGSIAAATLLVYLSVRNHHFVWDTIPFVVENPWIHAWTIDNLVSMLTKAHQANWQPVVMLSHALDFSLYGADSGSHHLTNLALHILNALLLFRLVSLLVVHSRFNTYEQSWIAAITAILFAIHPQHVESVAWVVERKDVLYALFAFACLISYLTIDTRAPNRARHLIPFLFFCLSIGAKPMAVTLPAVLVLLDVFPLGRVNSLRALAVACLSKAHYLLVSLVVVAITLKTQAIAMPGDALPLLPRLLNAINNYVFYIGHYVWPLNLSPFYPYPKDLGDMTDLWYWVPGVLFLFGMMAFTGWLFYRHIRWPLLLFAFYVVTLAPVSGLIHVGPAKATDHYVYLATIPFALITALLIVYLSSMTRYGQVLAASVTVAYVGFLMAVANVQVTIWNNEVSLFMRVTNLYPDDPFGHRNLASAYVQIGEFDEALQHAERSLVLGSPDRDYVYTLRAFVEAQALKVKP